MEFEICRTFNLFLFSSYFVLSPLSSLYNHHSINGKLDFSDSTENSIWNFKIEILMYSKHRIRNWNLRFQFRKLNLANWNELHVFKRNLRSLCLLTILMQFGQISLVIFTKQLSNRFPIFKSHKLASKMPQP